MRVPSMRGNVAFCLSASASNCRARSRIASPWDATNSQPRNHRGLRTASMDLPAALQALRLASIRVRA